MALNPSRSSLSPQGRFTNKKNPPRRWKFTPGVWKKRKKSTNADYHFFNLQKTQEELTNHGRSSIRVEPFIKYLSLIFTFFFTHPSSRNVVYGQMNFLYNLTGDFSVVGVDFSRVLWSCSPVRRPGNTRRGALGGTAALPLRHFPWVHWVICQVFLFLGKTSKNH